MKLSAPPPPPPSDGTPGENAPGSPDEQPNSNPSGANASGSSPVADTPAASQTPKQAGWPAWYGGIDGALVGLVLAFAFVAASFVARNSDLWLHLAGGKRLFAGEYFPGGSDQFSYSAEGRTWVNHSWLTDAVAYLLYNDTGKLLVGAKALVVALAFGILIAIRRPKFSLWPWAACACVGVLAAAPQFTLRPLVVSMLLLAVTMYLLFRMPHKKDSWRFPGAIGITFWVWANCDQWFFVGPLSLALLIIGDLIQKYGFNAPDEPASDPDAEPLGRLPDTATLAKALGIGILACTLTPHHLGVWELPFEITGANGVEADPRLRFVLLTPVDSEYLSKPGGGSNVNGLAYLIFLVVGATVVGLAGALGVGRIRPAHIAMWLGFAVLTFLSIYAIPLFAIVAIPLVASQLNAFSTRAELKTLGDPRTRLLLIGSSVGRVLSVLGVCVLCVLAYPGWVHPEAPTPAYARRMAWTVEPDPALVQAAEKLQQWRESDALSADNRGFITNTDLANYAAWYAPKVKVFVNTRYRHHRRELADYVTVRKGLGLVIVKDSPANPKDAAEVLARRNVDYVATYGASTDAVRRLYLHWGEWSVWYTDGRTAVFGWRPAPTGGKPSFAGLRLDPVVKAFGPSVKKASDPVLQQPLAQPDTATDADRVVAGFAYPAKLAPPGGAECLGWIEYKQGLLRRQQVRAGLAELLFFYTPATQHTFHNVAVLGPATQGALRFPPKHEETEAFITAQRAVPLLAVRAARRAIAEDPDHPDAYYALAQALRDSDLPLTDSERALGRIIAYHQCLDRLPKPVRYRRGQFAVIGTQVALELADAYLGQRFTWRDPSSKKELTTHTGFPIDIPGLWELLGQTVLETRHGTIERVSSAAIRGRPLTPDVRPYADGTPHLLAIDLVRDALRRALEYAKVDTAGEDTEEASALKKKVEGLMDVLVNEEVRYRNPYNAAKARGAKLPELVHHAIQNCMIGEAHSLLANADIETLEKEYNGRPLVSGVQRVVIELAVGRIEDADENLKILSAPERVGAIENLRAGPHLQQLKYQKALQAGEYRAAGELVASMESRELGLDPLLAEIANAQLDPNKLLLAELGRMPPPVAGGGLLPSYLALHCLGDRYGQALRAREAIASKMQQDAQFFYRRGTLALLEADMPAAKDWFKQSRREPPPGWRLNPIIPQNAALYLELIERAAKQPAGP